VGSLRAAVDRAREEWDRLTGGPGPACICGAGRGVPVHEGGCLASASAPYSDTAAAAILALAAAAWSDTALLMGGDTDPLDGQGV
jgi:hypothetical protein